MTSTQLILTRKLQSPEYNDKYKTELCRNWMAGFCSFDSKCVFAHGKEELREKPQTPFEDFLIEEISVIQEKPSTNDDPPTSSNTKRRLPIFVELSRGV